MVIVVRPGMILASAWRKSDPCSKANRTGSPRSFGGRNESSIVAV